MRSPEPKTESDRRRPRRRTRRRDLDPFLIEDATLTRDELMRVRDADTFWQHAPCHAA